MKSRTKPSGRIPIWLLALALVLFSAPPQAAQSPEIRSFIVQGLDLDSARTAVHKVGGTIVRELGIIKAVNARLTDEQMQQVRQLEGIRRVYLDGKVNAQSKK